MTLFQCNRMKLPISLCSVIPILPSHHGPKTAVKAIAMRPLKTCCIGNTNRLLQTIRVNLPFEAICFAEPSLSLCLGGTGSVFTLDNPPRALQAYNAFLLASGGGFFGGSSLNSFTSLGNTVSKPPKSTNLSFVGDVFVADALSSNTSTGLLVASSTGDGLKTGEPLILLYTTSNYSDWEFDSVWYRANVSSGPRVECPSIYSLDDQELLIHSAPADGKTHWALGSSTKSGFVTTTTGILDYGSAYAGRAFFDHFGRLLVMFYVNDGLPASMQAQQGYANYQSLPRVLSVANGQVVSTPVAELDSLVDSTEHLNFEVSHGNWTGLTGTRASRYQLEFTIKANSPDGLVHLDLLSNNNQTEYTRLTLSQSNTGLGCLNSSFLQNTDHPGDDLDHITLTGANATAEHCLSLCCQRSGCVAMVFAHPQPGTQEDVCWLKSSITSPKSLANVTSAVVASQTTTLTLDTTRASSLPEAPGQVISMDVQGTPQVSAIADSGWSSTVSLDIIIDNSIIEVFGGNRAMTTSVHPQSDDVSRVMVHAINAQVAISGTHKVLAVGEAL
eukprot:m.98318 g.98318  ORF g.98318 m.98318 type:complete len:558 (+) comp15077_c0_seq1:108-1781(+)